MVNSATLRKANNTLLGHATKKWNKKTSIFSDETTSGRSLQVVSKP